MGVGAADLVGTLLSMRSQSNNEDTLVAKANCGIPQFVDGEIQYTGTPELMAEYARLARDCGVRIIGGCCGTTPVHLAAMNRALLNHHPRPMPDIEMVVSALGPVTAGTRHVRSHSTSPVEYKCRSRQGRRHRA